MSVKITQLQAENFKRVKAVQLEPLPSGLTIIGGNNNQGKTSILDAIAWALGGDRYRPSAPTREGSVIPPKIHVTLSNGLEVERSGKNGTLKVSDPSGKRGGQQLLNEFVETFALDLPKFMNQSATDKAKTLLRVIGIDKELMELDKQERTLYADRLATGRIAEQKANHAKDLPYWDGVPKEPISAAELIKQQQDILHRNAENAKLRQHKEELADYLMGLQRKIEQLRGEESHIIEQLKIASKAAEDLHDESTAELEANLRDIDAVNVKVRQNIERERAEDEAALYKDQYNELTHQIENIRASRMQLLTNADLPLKGLSVADDNEITYNGQKWDNMSGSEQLKVATAIVRRLNPSCGFVLLDKLEQMDVDNLSRFGQWLAQEGLQAIATRVSSGDECSIIIEDGCSVGQLEHTTTPTREWKGGTF